MNAVLEFLATVLRRNGCVVISPGDPVPVGMAAAWVEGQGGLVVWPGQPVPLEMAVRRMTEAGYVLVPPNTLLPLDLSLASVRAAGCLAVCPGDPIPLDRATAAVKEAGYRLVTPPPPPPNGSVWVPTRGEGKDQTHIGALPREVDFADEDHVDYHSGPARHRCTLASWSRWVALVRARQQIAEPPANPERPEPPDEGLHFPAAQP